MVGPSTSFIAALCAVLAILLGTVAPGSFAAYLARLSRRSGERGIDVIITWLAGQRVDAQDRRDVAQDVIIQALKTWRSFDPSRAAPNGESRLFARWLFAIMRRVIWQRRGKAYHHREVQAEEPVPPTMPDPAPSPPERMVVEETRLGVLEGLQQVDLELRAILVAHDIDGIPMTELAERHGMPLATLYAHRARAMTALREVMDERERRERRRERQRAWRARRGPVRGG